MDITPEMVTALKFLRSYVGTTVVFAVAWNTLDNAGVFAAIDEAADSAETELGRTATPPTSVTRTT